MNHDNHYFLTAGKYNGELVYIDYERLNGFKVAPRNQVEYDGIIVNKLILVKPSFAEKIIKRKIKRKLDAYLQYLIHMIEEDDEDGSMIDIALDDLDRYRRTIHNTYQKYLDDLYVDLLLKKIKLLEQELRMKQVEFIKNEETEKTSHRGR